MLRERLLYRVWTVGSVAVLYVNLFVGLAGVLYLQLQAVWWAWGAVAVVSALPLVGLYVANRRKSRVVRAVGEAVRERLGVEKRGRGVAAWAFLAVVVGTFVALGPGNRLMAVSLLGLAVLSPIMRLRNDPLVRRVALVAMSGWCAVGAIGLGLFELAGVDPGVWPGVVWMVSYPAGLPARVLRRPLRAAYTRSDAIGGLARRLVPLLLPVERAVAARMAGDPVAARTLIVERFRLPQTTVAMGEALLELAAVSADQERSAWLAGAAHLLPDRPEPFARLAEEVSDPEAALLYAAFAEANASRTLTHDAGTYTALRARLQSSQTQRP